MLYEILVHLNLPLPALVLALTEAADFVLRRPAAEKNSVVVILAVADIH
jgi:hypothetical protein